MIELIEAASDSGGARVGLTIFWLFSFVAYWVPTIVAFVRNVPNKGSVTVINFFLGWTIIGWIVALAMSVRSKPPAYPPQQYPPQPYPGQQYPPPGVK